MSTSNFDKNDPFYVEILRENYAKKGNRNGFLGLYKSDCPKIKNYNSQKHWDDMLVKEKDSLSPMTLDRIKQTAKLAINYLNLNYNKTHKLFDIGIGNGYVEAKIQNIFKGKCNYFGLDIAKTNLNKIKSQLPRFRGKVANIEDFKVNKFNNTFDLVLALEILEHIDADRVFNVYKKIHSLLTNKGHLILSVPIYENLKEKIENNTNFSAHVRRYTPEIIKFELNTAGFKVINEIKLYAFSKNYRLKSYIAKTFSFGKPNLIIIECVKQ